MPFFIHSLLMCMHQVFCRRCMKFPPSEQKSSAINWLPVIKPSGLRQPALIVIYYDMKCEPDVSSAPALRDFHKEPLRNTPLTSNPVCNRGVLLHMNAVWKLQLSGFWQKTHLISLSHVAVEDPPHALDGRMLQFMGPPQVIINAPAQRGEHGEHKREGRTTIWKNMQLIRW